MENKIIEVKKKRVSISDEKLSRFLLNKVKQKREFSMLPDSIVNKALLISKNDVKETRAILRKYIGVFLTNRVLKGREEDILKFHLSSKLRDYSRFYKEIFNEDENTGSILDLGCGVNGFSYKYIKELLGDVNYIGIEAAEQLVNSTNSYFEKEKFNAKVIWGDLFDDEKIINLLKKQKKPRVVFMFQIIDALEVFEKDFSKRFIFNISKECEKVVLSYSIRSLSGKKNFIVKRKWLIDLLNENFFIEKDFEIGDERILIFRNK